MYKPRICRTPEPASRVARVLKSAAIARCLVSEETPRTRSNILQPRRPRYYESCDLCMAKRNVRLARRFFFALSNDILISRLDTDFSSSLSIDRPITIIHFIFTRIRVKPRRCIIERRSVCPCCGLRAALTGSAQGNLIKFYATYPLI